MPLDEREFEQLPTVRKNARIRIQDFFQSTATRRQKAYSTEEISEAIGLAIRTVNFHLGKMNKEGYLEKRHSPRHKGNFYKLKQATDD